jgi:hypothetical protein
MQFLSEKNKEMDLLVIAGHSRPKNGVASLAYDPAIHHLLSKMDTRVKPAYDII